MHQDDATNSDAPPKPNSGFGDFTLRSRTTVGIGKYADHFNEAIAATLAKVPELGRKAPQLEHAIQNLDHPWVQRFAEDLYDAYQISSGEVTRVIPPARLLECFRLVKPHYPLVTFWDFQHFDELPEKFPIFRGGRGPESTLRHGFSWTLDPDIAEAYMESDGDLVIRAVVKKSDVLAYFAESDECIVGLSDSDHVATVTRFDKL